MKTGEALISLQNEDGEPTIVDRFTILPPQSKMGTIEQSEREIAKKISRYLIFYSFLVPRFISIIVCVIQMIIR